MEGFGEFVPGGSRDTGHLQGVGDVGHRLRLKTMPHPSLPSSGFRIQDGELLVML